MTTEGDLKRQLENFIARSAARYGGPTVRLVDGPTLEVMFKTASSMETFWGDVTNARASEPLGQITTRIAVHALQANQL